MNAQMVLPLIIELFSLVGEFYHWVIVCYNPLKRFLSFVMVEIIGVIIIIIIINNSSYSRSPKQLKRRRYEISEVFFLLCRAHTFSLCDWGTNSRPRSCRRYETRVLREANTPFPPPRGIQDHQYAEMQKALILKSPQILRALLISPYVLA